jgi:hypothetical protein
VVLGEEIEQAVSSSQIAALGHSQAVADSVHRLECLYFKLYVGLRYVVRRAFAKHRDVLDAGMDIQVRDSAGVRLTLNAHLSSLVSDA